MSNTETSSVPSVASFTPSEIELANKLDGVFQRVTSLADDARDGEVTNAQLVKRLERIEMLLARVIAPYVGII